MGRHRLALAALGAALAVGSALSTGSGATAATSADARAAWDGCVAGDICVYSGDNGTGSVCAWDGDDSDWLGGAVKCSWAGTKNVHSIWNRGTGGAGSYRHVKFYEKASHAAYVGCVDQNAKGNNGGSAGRQLRSHKWVTSC
ncbi:MULTISPECIES: peptidase inhibitor family I36 protein [unclassified Streptomyces]|uniref:peptidase inhibitor family I36 protein n=1 Tax=Streptomyces sp. NPDC055082 TaxID=3365718 RepID=UPI0037D4C645